MMFRIYSISVLLVKEALNLLPNPCGGLVYLCCGAEVNREAIYQLGAFSVKLGRRGHPAQDGSRRLGTGPKTGKCYFNVRAGWW